MILFLSHRWEKRRVVGRVVVDASLLRYHWIDYPRFENTEVVVVVAAAAAVQPNDNYPRIYSYYLPQSLFP
jgi:hypothetical protein